MGEFLFTTLRGERLDDRYLWAMVKRLARKAGVVKDVHPIVLARLAEAGVEVYRTDEAGTAVATSDSQKITFEKAASAGKERAPTQEPTPAPASDPVPGKININTASLEELQQIVHIGPERAQEIIRLRPFRSLDELTRVKGIGPARLEDIKAQGVAYVCRIGG